MWLYVIALSVVVVLASSETLEEIVGGDKEGMHMYLCVSIVTMALNTYDHVL